MARLSKYRSGGDEVSKFKAIFDAQAKEAEPEATIAEEVIAQKKPSTKSQPDTKKSAKPQTQAQPIAKPEVEPKRGRPKGKRSHPDYEQVTAYIKTLTYQEVKIALLREGQKREFSELVQELLDNWLESRS